MKAAPGFAPPTAVPAAFSRDVDAASFRRLRRRQFRRLRRIYVRNADTISDVEQAFMRREMFAMYLDATVA